MKTPSTGPYLYLKAGEEGGGDNSRGATGRMSAIRRGRTREQGFVPPGA